MPCKVGKNVNTQYVCKVFKLHFGIISEQVFKTGNRNGIDRKKQEDKDQKQEVTGSGLVNQRK